MKLLHERIVKNIENVLLSANSTLILCRLMVNHYEVFHVIENNNNNNKVNKISIFSVAGMLALASCHSQGENKNQELESLSVDSLLKVQDHLIGDTVSLNGFCVEVCGHGSTHVILMGSDSTKVVNVEAGEQLSSFSKDVLNSNVHVNAVIEEERVDEAFLADWERRLDESLKAPDGGNPQAVAVLKQQIAEIRAVIAERVKAENKNYYSQYHIVATEYDFEK